VTRPRLILDVLAAVTRDPGLDDVEIARRLGRVAYDVSVVLRELAELGLLEEDR
jgi:DNA-binding IclR family transcriptional regulator